jgi:hypothetical protein
MLWCQYIESIYLGFSICWGFGVSHYWRREGNRCTIGMGWDDWSAANSSPLFTIPGSCCFVMESPESMPVLPSCIVPTTTDVQHKIICKMSSWKTRIFLFVFIEIRYWKPLGGGYYYYRRTTTQDVFFAYLFLNCLKFWKIEFETVEPLFFL